jgi:signal transduction histidine kinase
MSQLRPLSGDAPPSARYSLRWRLPLLVSSLIAGVLAVFVWAAYREVERTLVLAGSERAQGAADQLGTSLSEPTRSRMLALRSVASDPVLVPYLERPADETGVGVRARLTTLVTPGRQVVVLWNAAGKPLLTVTTPDEASDMAPTSPPPPSRPVRLLQTSQQAVFAEMIEPVPSPTGGPPLGYLTIRRPVTLSPAPEILNRLVGGGARVLVGIVGDSVWTDLAQLIPPPPVDTGVRGTFVYKAADNTARIGAVGEVTDTPWRVWVEFPRETVVAPAKNFLRGILFIGAVLVWCAVILVAVFAWQVTTPLTALTHAAEAIAKGDYTRRVGSTSRDEVGRLTRAFDTMADQIESAQQRLLHDLEARTKMEDARRALEDQLEQSRKMEAVGRLAGGVAHDFNNLLTAILGYSNLVLEELEPGHPARSDVEQMRRAGESAASLTQQLLAFSRKQILQPQVLDLNTVVTRAQSLLQRLIGEHIRLVTALDPSIDRVSADPGQLEQVIVNLAINARDAMPEGGNLTIETANVELDDAYVQQHGGSSPGTHVMLAVSDTGVGMDAETRAHIFEPFFTTKRRGEGTGLGLSTVYGIVTQSGGSIWVYSEPTRGTTFKVYFPSASAADPQVVAAPATDGLAGTETILLAEDQPEVRSVARAVLERYGYRVLEAKHGDEALRIVRAHREPIHLLLSDVVMPSMSGPELARLVQLEQSGIRILYASGYTDDAIVRHGVLDPGVAFLQKPFTPTALLRKIRELLDAPMAAGM